ncbi:hypothetical protein [Desulfallas thermosapovorans]|uniref:Uncharacterized protein n=1 Tax=Desulfallas thermosapovorans DSM 6562 TaxID=1121431 RepID=A0A5S4ZPW8_9FIRM|nr:hypothetical protein [Desulfallas thermosapovorans]TYO94711.1 hypothetical protein LX24_02180 [Desulfallas thermosapovorans DSM 6562]
MKPNNIYRITIDGDNPRQYHLHSRWLAEVYLQTYRQMGKQVSIEQLVDGFWQPLQVYYTGA